ncbi:MAG: radical SAM protein [Rickettsiales bacterium]|jgi:oxygen-independent coproporphyrinogen-3 oxidase|nr:radical SAM protein [Rickettsiales bacterium]
MNLYIHVPFCLKKCNYCAFHSVACAAPDWDGYIREISEQLDSGFAQSGFGLSFPRRRERDLGFETVFFGGGTPSLLPVKYAEKIIRKLNLAPDCEFTIEANPKTLSSLELKDWKDLGLNRLSIGMQSFDDDELRFLGRVHTVADSLEMLAAANDLGLRVSGDFIYGLPNHAVSDVVKLCERINDAGLRHASLYELTIERGTKFQNLSPVPESIGAEMYLAIQDALGLPRYEISNYGDPCRHNAAVWAGGEYIGVGESAAGRILKNGEWFETKITGGKILENKLTARERAVEMAMTGLRTMRGTDIRKTPDVINWDFVNKNPAYFSSDGDFLRMTDSGLMLLDGLMKEILT